MTYNNIIDVYNRLVEVSNQLHDEHSPDAIGYDKAIFTFQYALKQYVSINLHLENKSLQRQLSHVDALQNKIKECNISRDAALQSNKQLRTENQRLREELNALRAVYIKVSANKILK